MKRWPAVSAMAQSSEVVERKDDDGVTYHHRLVKYEYQVGRQVYVTAETSAAQFKKGAQRMADQVQPGNRVTVYYDPLAPSVSTLEPGFRPLTYFLLVPSFFGVLMLLMV